MEYHKTPEPKFATKKWIKKWPYSRNNIIKFKTSMLR